MRSRLTTPWKKSRTYGDIYGGRQRRRMTDNIFARAHSLQAPGEDQDLPLLIQDNVSSAYRFPVSAQELAQALARLPANHRDGITHICLRRALDRRAPMAGSLVQFVCGSGVRAIILYPWRVDGSWYRGHRPSQDTVALLQRYFGANIHCDAQGYWHVDLAQDALRRFYLEHLLCFGVGLHVDWLQRRWSHANDRKVHAFANQYAAQWGRCAVGTDVKQAR